MLTCVNQSVDIYHAKVHNSEYNILNSDDICSTGCSLPVYLDGIYTRLQ
jgi:hypothetical protein